MGKGKDKIAFHAPTCKNTAENKAPQPLPTHTPHPLSSRSEEKQVGRPAACWLTSGLIPCRNRATIASMRIIVLGAGALGCYYGAKLAEAGEDVSFIMRSAYEPVRKEGLHIAGKYGDLHIDHPQIYRTPEEAGKADLVILTWKTTANGQLADALPTLLHEGTKIITLQNGMGNAEALSRYIAPENIYIGLCFICAMMPTPGRIEHLEGGDIQFAPYIPSAAGLVQAEEYAALFARAGIKTRAFEQAEQIQWCKLTWNIPFNGLCLALGGISVEQLFTMPEQVERAVAIMKEVVLTAEMRGYKLPGNIVDYQMERTATMGAFIPSSAVDYNMGRPVEYEAIWGSTLAKAREVNAPVPHWEQLCADIRARLDR